MNSPKPSAYGLRQASQCTLSQSFYRSTAILARRAGGGFQEFFWLVGAKWRQRGCVVSSRGEEVRPKRGQPSCWALQPLIVFPIKGTEADKGGVLTTITFQALRPSASASWNSKPSTIRLAFFFNSQPSLGRLISLRSSIGNSRNASSRCGWSLRAASTATACVGVHENAALPTVREGSGS